MTDLADDRAAALRLRPVSRETIKLLDGLVEQLLLWQKTINLVSPSTLSQVWSRHIADSLQLVDHAPPATNWVDLGSGGGFPGLVVACALPGTSVHLIESQQRKAAFLRETARILGLRVQVHPKRIEDAIAPLAGKAEVVSARALASLPKLLDYCEPLLEKGAQALFPKGQDVDAELTEASISWHIEADLIPSLTEPAARIVRIRHAKRR